MTCVSDCCTRQVGSMDLCCWCQIHNCIICVQQPKCVFCGGAHTPNFSMCILLFCSLKLYKLIIWVTVAFQSAWTHLAILYWPLSLTKHPQNCPLLDIFFLLLHYFEWTPETVKHENLSRSVIQNTTFMPQWKSLRSILPALFFVDLNVTWSCWPILAWLYALHCQYITD